MVKAKKGVAKKGGNKKGAALKKEEPIVDETGAWEEEATEETVEETVEEEVEEENEENDENAENEAEEENEEEAKEEAEEEEEEEAENEAENDEETEDGAEKPKREPKPNNYLTTHPEEFSSQIMKDIRNDFNTANRRGQRFNGGMKKDMLRIRQKRAQLSLDTILVYGEREYRNCSSVPLMSLSFTLRETIQKFRKSIGSGKRDEVCPEKLHHTIIKVDSDLGLNGLRSVIKWMHTGDLNLTAENFEEIVAVVLFFRIKMLRQSLVKLARRVGIKFVPVPANEKTIERRKKEGKPTLPNGFEESEKLEDGEEALPEDAKVVEGKDILAKIKSAARIQYLKEIPKSENAQKKEAERLNRNAKREENNRKREENSGKKAQQNNRKRSNTDNKISETGEAKKGKMNDGGKREGGMGNNNNNKGNDERRRNNTSGGARGGRATGSRGTFTSTRGGARGGSHSGGKSIYREHSQQAQAQLQTSYQPPQPNYYQPAYQAPQAYGYAPPQAPQYQQPMQQGYQQQPPQPYQGYRQQQPPQQGGAQQQGYYGSYGR